MSKQTNFLPILLLLKLLLPTTKAANYPFTCTPTSPKSCTSLLYHSSSCTNNNLNINDIASLYSSSNNSLIKPFIQADKNGYLVPVNCSCEALVNGTTTAAAAAYLHRTIVTTNSASTVDVAYNGQVYNASDGVVSLFCGCLYSGDTVVTYTVEAGDSLYGIARTFSSDVGEIEKCNERRNLTAYPNYIDVGWVLFVPLLKVHGPPANDKANPKTSVIIGALITVSFFATGVVFMFFIRRRKSRHINENPKSVTKNKSNKNLTSMQNQFLHLQNMEDGTHFESERPFIYNLEDVEEATANFDETRKIGQGGYGGVYFGMLGKQEVAIKKMKSNKSKEFFAELTVLCKVHHINVVELIGYATGDDHLYLVYEYVQNGSLSDHLHDPLLKGHQPLSWSARTQIALDAARGIEYIHDHTKSQYVHRDIKTSNILLDGILRAKVADFGLAKLVERTGEGDCIATRLVGTPGYLPPESVRELQMTTKSDVFAFGVVLAELITGLRALIGDNREAVNMKSLVSIIYATFCEENPQSALEGIIDGNLKGSYPVEEVFKVAELSAWCLNADAVNRPEMHEIVMKLSQIVTASIEWEASLGGDSQVFSGLFNGR